MRIGAEVARTVFLLEAGEPETRPFFRQIDFDQEEAFVIAMIKESKQFATQCQWFTTLVSKAATLPSIYRALQKVGAQQVKTIDMQQGQKQSRIVAWTFVVSS